MKVLHVIPSLSQAHGGPSRALALMEQALTEIGVQVETATTDDDGPGQRNAKSAKESILENGVIRRYFRKRLDFYKASPALAQWIAANASRYDLIHIHALFSFTSTAAARAARRSGVPYVIRPLGTLNDYGIKRRRPWLKRISLKLIEGPILRRAAAVHFTSEAEAAEARRLGIAMKAVVIPLGVEVGASPSATSAARALYLSRLDPKKNVEGLLDAIELLKDEIPALHLVIAGDGEPDYVASLKARADALSISDRITWAGHLQGPAKQAALATAAVFVLPSYSENFGIAAAEALAAGLPCVLGQGVAIAQEVVDAGAGVAVETDSKSIAAGLHRIISDESVRIEMSVRARQLAQQNFSASAMGIRLQQLYSDILNR